MIGWWCEVPKVQLQVGTDASEIKWVRASSLFPNAQLVVDGSSKDDVNQGRLGNCWFLCALVGAATIPHIFKKLVPRDQVMHASFGSKHFQMIVRLTFKFRGLIRSSTLASSTSSSGSTAPGWTSSWTTSSPPWMESSCLSRATTGKYMKTDRQVQSSSNCDGQG